MRIEGFYLLLPNLQLVNFSSIIGTYQIMPQMNNNNKSTNGRFGKSLQLLTCCMKMPIWKLTDCSCSLLDITSINSKYIFLLEKIGFLGQNPFFLLLPPQLTNPSALNLFSDCLRCWRLLPTSPPPINMMVKENYRLDYIEFSAIRGLF